MGRDRESTDRAILGLLKTRGPQRAAELARRLGITAMAVRQQLARLAERGEVRHTQELRPVGRPARLWHPTQVADARFPQSYPELALDLLEAMRESVGTDGLDRVLVERTRRQAARYRAEVPGRTAPLARRVAALARIRSREGYLARSSKERDGSVTLVENHCPICEAARACQGLCAGELALFQDVLGQGVSIERTEHIVEGARRCVYRIRKRR